MQPKTTALEFFRLGSHVAQDGSSVTFGSADLDAIVASYDPAKHEAPIVVGHPTTNAPAFGWVKGLRRKGASLEADVDLAESFADAVKAKHYKKVSASFYKPTSPGNPTPGNYHLRHIGFLGATPPAVKGLREIAFADDAELVTVDLADSETAQAFAVGDMVKARGKAGGTVTEARGAPCDFYLVTFGAEPAAWFPADELELEQGVEETTSLSEADRTRAADLTRREAELARRERALRMTEHVAFCESVVRDGRPLPGPRADVVGILEVLESAQAGEVTFSEPTAKPADVFRSMLKRLPKQVDFAERSAPTDLAESDGAVDIAARAQAFQATERAAGRHVSTDVAVAHVLKKGS